MSTTLMITIAVFIGVALLVVAVASLMRDKDISQMEGRLNALTGKGDKGDPSSLGEMTKLLAAQREDGQSALDVALSRWFNLNRLFEQAQVMMSTTSFLAACAGLGIGAFTLCAVAGVSLTIAPAVGGMFAMLPFGWLMFRRKKRFKRFAAQLPEALELVARALRAGHSLAAGFKLVGSEMSDPISSEFNRVFEEQNLGIPFEEALDGMTERIPNLDLKFFVTAVILQRQTGGDLAEILDKIGSLVRDRFRIWGQVQALTGEGRLSGIVLLALPPLLFAAVWRMNPDYLMVLFTDDLGKKMLIGGIVMQLLGALVIRKIVNIRV
ncbi:MAG: secretion protein [Planctomycetaceae bacterium]|nr:secretion protein [Planctomycetaceae bacterium]